jgi:hypothetical protein
LGTVESCEPRHNDYVLQDLSSLFAGRQSQREVTELSKRPETHGSALAR